MPTLTVLAAASLTDAMADLGDAFASATAEVHPGLSLQFSFGPSSALATQLLAGAPADVFASADEASMARAVAGGAVTATPEIFARNELTLAVPAGNPGGVSGLEDLARDDLLVGLCAEQVPCGRLARELLARTGVIPALATNETDVRSLLTKIEANELDAGLVYRSDIGAAEGWVEGIDVPGADQVVALYPIAPLEASKVPDLAEDFVAFVGSDQGRRILVEHGFLAP